MADPQGDQRRFRRAVLTHPIRFKLFARDARLAPTVGYVKDMSLGGARIRIQDRFGQVQATALRGQRAKLEITLPDGDTLHVVSLVTWVKRPITARQEEVELGVQFELLEGTQLQKISALLAMRHTDRTLLWSMWDSFQAGGR